MGSFGMILYHGSNIIIEKIDLNKCRPYKDFGKESLNDKNPRIRDILSAKVELIF